MKRDDLVEIGPTLRDAVGRAAEAEGVSLAEFVHRVLIDRLAFSNPDDYFAARSERGRAESLSALLDRAGDEPPQDGDRIEGGFGRDAAE